ncbi:MAG: T9SS type A sorting domain-containing protein [Bacteroidetes bacterium]|nr:T9SS type A sorting domain-containing protein [Bacteroidota bacterium]
MIPSGSDMTMIPPFGFKLFWADQQRAQGENHLDFLLNGNSNGCLYLLKPDSVQDDQICYAVIPVDSSFGRAGDGNANWRLFKVPTPNSTNIDLSIGVHEIPQHGNLIVFPNPAIGKHIFFNKLVTFELFDLTGRKLLEAKNCRESDVSGLASGVYYIRILNGESVKLVIP